MAALPDPLGNHLLAALPPATLRHWMPLLEPVDMPLGKVLHDPGETMACVYFPVTAIVALLYVTMEGGSTETALVGNEGVLCVSSFMGGRSTLTRAVVQAAGHGVRLPARLLQEEFERNGETMHLLLRYTQALMSQTGQTAVCNRHHALDQQLCRWLLLNMDRTEGNDLAMTHELIGHMLGVRRESITTAALKLQADGLIQYRRGHVHVLDRAGLEHRACECYGVVRREYDRLLDPALRRDRHGEPRAVQALQ